MRLESKININAKPEKVWELLLKKVFEPNEFIPGIEEFNIVEREENEFVRTLYTETDDVVELITLFPEEMEMTFSLVKHAFLKGLLTNKILADGENSILCFEQNREVTMEELKGIDMQPALDAAVLQIKELAEA